MKSNKNKNQNTDTGWANETTDGSQSRNDGKNEPRKEDLRRESWPGSWIKRKKMKNQTNWKSMNEIEDNEWKRKNKTMKEKYSSWIKQIKRQI